MKLEYISDVDECKMLSNPCKKGKCTNTVGGYKCECDMGYKNTGSAKMPQCVGKSNADS